MRLCPLKPGLRCSATVKLGSETPCPTCSAWRDKPNSLACQKKTIVDDSANHNRTLWTVKSTIKTPNFHTYESKLSGTSKIDDSDDTVRKTEHFTVYLQGGKR